MWTKYYDSWLGWMTYRINAPECDKAFLRALAFSKQVKWFRYYTLGWFQQPVCTLFISFYCFSLLRDVLHRGARAMIYLFIAGSYTPWLTLKAYDSNGWSIQLNWAIWILAFFGIIYQQIFHERYKWLETTIYVTVALAPSLAVFEMVSGLFWYSGYRVLISFIQYQLVLSIHGRRVISVNLSKFLRHVSVKIVI